MDHPGMRGRKAPPVGKLLSRSTTSARYTYGSGSDHIWEQYSYRWVTLRDSFHLRE
jgi:hypothetical protein